MASYTASFAPSGGLHPTLHLSIHPGALAAPSSCTLYALVDVPRGLIADRYQLVQLQRDGRLGARGEADGAALVHVGEADLEAPVWRARGARVLVRLGDEGSGRVDDEGDGRARELPERVDVEVPLHLRYQEPVERRWEGDVRADVTQVEVEWPHVFYACDRAPPDAWSASSCPASSLPDLALSLPHLNASSTLHFFPPSASPRSSTSSSAQQTPACPPARPPPLKLSAPTGVLADLPLVEGVTAAAVWACFAYLCWTAGVAYRRGRSRAERDKRA